MFNIYSAKELAKFIILYLRKSERKIDNLKLNYILYIIQREYLKKCGRPLFYDKITINKYGILIESVYYRYCMYGAMDIDSFMIKDDIEIKNNDKEFVEYIVDNFFIYDALELSKKN